MYSQKIIDSFEHCLHYFVDGDLANVTGTSGRLEDGEVVRLYLYIENDIVKSARFRAMGNVMTIAAAEELCKELENKSVITFDTGVVIKNLSPIPDYREHCIIKALEAYYDALQNFKV
jgi:nitrogen fixation NifU-like protein